MRHIILSLFVLFFSLFFGTGCQESVADPLEQADQLARQAIVILLNEDIERSYGHQVFQLAPGTVLFISPGAVEGDDEAMRSGPFTIVTIARKYNALKSEYKTVKTAGTKVRANKKNPAYPYQAKLSLTLNIILTEYSICNGFPLSVVTPAEWAGWSPGKRRSHLGDFHAKLPPKEFDYMAIAEMPGSNPSATQETKSFDIVWSKREKQWQLASHAGESPQEVKAGPPTWPAAGAAEDLRQKHFEAAGFVRHGGKYFPAADIEIVKYKEQGLEFHGGKWQDPAKIQALLKFRELLGEWNRSGAVGQLPNVLQALNQLSGTDSFDHSAELTVAALLNFVKTCEQKDDEKKLGQLLHLLNNNPQLKAVDTGKLGETILAAQEEIKQKKQRNTLEAQIKQLAAMRKNLQERRDFLELMTDFAPDRIANINIVTLKKLQSYINADKGVPLYLTLIGIVRNQPEFLNTYMEHLNDSRLVDLYQKCTRCTGGGTQSCGSCGGSGICRSCGGSGTQTIRDPSGGRKRVPCAPKCGFCLKSSACASCRGFGLVFFRDKAQKRLGDFYGEFINEVNIDIEASALAVEQLRKTVEQKKAAGVNPVAAGESQAD